MGQEAIVIFVWAGRGSQIIISITTRDENVQNDCLSITVYKRERVSVYLYVCMYVC